MDLDMQWTHHRMRSLESVVEVEPISLLEASLVAEDSLSQQSLLQAEYSDLEESEGTLSDIFEDDLLDSVSESSSEQANPQQSLSLEQICFLIYLILVFLMSTAVNTSILLAFVRKSSLRTTSNRFIIQLLVVNLLSCCFLQPLGVLELLEMPVPAQCQLIHVISSLISSLSLLSTLLIGGDQYLAVQYPLRYRQHVTRCRASGASLAVVLTSCLVAALPLLSRPSASVWPSCQDSNQSGSLWSILPVMTYTILSFCFPVITLTVLYCKIYKEAHNNSERTRRNSMNPGENLYNITHTMVAPITLEKAASTHSIATQLELRHGGGVVLTKQDSIQSYHGPIVSNRLMLTKQDSVSSYHGAMAANNNNLLQHAKMSRNNSTLSTASPRSDTALTRRGSILTRSPSHIRSNLHHLRHRISNASNLIYREEGRTAKLYIVTLACILLSWSPLYLSSLASLMPGLDSLPPWSLYTVICLTCLYSLLSPAIFAYRNQKIRRELKRMFQLNTSNDDLVGHLPQHNNAGAGHLNGVKVASAVGARKRLKVSRSLSMREGEARRKKPGAVGSLSQLERSSSLLQEDEGKPSRIVMVPRARMEAQSLLVTQTMNGRSTGSSLSSTSTSLSTCPPPLTACSTHTPPPAPPLSSPAALYRYSPRLARLPLATTDECSPPVSPSSPNGECRTNPLDGPTVFRFPSLDASC